VNGYDVAQPNHPIRAQVSAATQFLVPPNPCMSSDPIYPWQQLVAATRSDPVGGTPAWHAFLAQIQQFVPTDPHSPATRAASTSRSTPRSTSLAPSRCRAAGTDDPIPIGLTPAYV